jgi:hypothetical protein
MNDSVTGSWGSGCAFNSANNFCVHRIIIRILYLELCQIINEIQTGSIEDRFIWPEYEYCVPGNQIPAENVRRTHPCFQVVENYYENLFSLLALRRANCLS